jgi:putative tributyrin esterase
MALIDIEIYSECLTRMTSFNVIVPEPGRGKVDSSGKYPVLWLLHGATDDYTLWQRYTSIERYVNNAGIAAVLPNADISFYTNVDGGRYFDYITEELPEICTKMFPISNEPKSNFIAGMSMGGYGTMKIGFTLPERYAAMGIFSSANFIDLMSNMEPGDDPRHPLNLIRELVFGVWDLNEAHGTEHDMIYLAKKASESGKPLPKVFGACGTCDSSVAKEKEMFEWMKTLDNPYECVFMESCGVHDFEFWDKWLPVFLQWLPIQAKKADGN